LSDYLASKGGDWGIRSSIKSLFDLQALFIDEKSCRLDGLKDDPMPLERQVRKKSRKYAVEIKSRQS
jgi:hypothetical protein